MGSGIGKWPRVGSEPGSPWVFRPIHGRGCCLCHSSPQSFACLRINKLRLTRHVQTVRDWRLLAELQVPQCIAGTSMRSHMVLYFECECSVYFIVLFRCI